MSRCEHSDTLCQSQTGLACRRRQSRALLSRADYASALAACSSARECSPLGCQLHRAVQHGSPATAEAAESFLCLFQTRQHCFDWRIHHRSRRRRRSTSNSRFAFFRECRQHQLELGYEPSRRSPRRTRDDCACRSRSVEIQSRRRRRRRCGGGTTDCRRVDDKDWQREPVRTAHSLVGEQDRVAHPRFERVSLPRTETAAQFRRFGRQQWQRNRRRWIRLPHRCGGIALEHVVPIRDGMGKRRRRRRTTAAERFRQRVLLVRFRRRRRTSARRESLFPARVVGVLVRDERRCLDLAVGGQLVPLVRRAVVWGVGRVPVQLDPASFERRRLSRTATTTTSFRPDNDGCCSRFPSRSPPSQLAEQSISELCPVPRENVQSRRRRSETKRRKPRSALLSFNQRARQRPHRARETAERCSRRAARPSRRRGQDEPQDLARPVRAYDPCSRPR